MGSLYEILKTSKMGAGAAPDLWTMLLANEYAGSPAEWRTVTDAPPVTINSDGSNATISIKGNTVQSGTPSPDNPIMPQGTGERTGNLFNKSATDITNGYMIDYYLLITGETSQYQAWRISEYIPVSSNDNYYLKWDSRESVAATTPSICFYSSTKSYIGGINYNNRTGLTFTTPNNTAYIRFSFIQSQVDYIMLNTGSTALPYEPYGIKIPISCGNQTTNTYLGEVPTTRKIKKLVLTGEETYNNYSYSGTNGVQITDMLNVAYKRANGICNIYPVSTAAGSAYCLWIGSGGNDRNLYFVSILSDMGLTDASEFKSWLAQQYANGTPVTVWYVLATPTTGIVNEPLMKIGDYADEVTGITIPTIAGANTIDVDTTVEPSEITVRYKG